MRSSLRPLPGEGQAQRAHATIKCTLVPSTSYMGTPYGPQYVLCIVPTWTCWESASSGSGTTSKSLHSMLRPAFLLIVS